MKKTAMILLALALGATTCKSESPKANVTTVTTEATTAPAREWKENTVQNDRELPMLGNFQLASGEDGHNTLVFFGLDGYMSIVDFCFDTETAMPVETPLYTGSYTIKSQPDENTYIVVFDLTAADGKKHQAGRIKMEYSDTTSEGIEHYNYRITPLKGYNLRLPKGQATEVPISAWQAWD